MSTSEQIIPQKKSLAEYGRSSSDRFNKFKEDNKNYNEKLNI